MKDFKCYSLNLENYLIEHGLKPDYYDGETAVYYKTKELQRLLDLYWIQYKVFKEI